MEYEPEARRLYLNAGSVRPTEMGTGRPRAAAGDSAYDDVLLPGEWASGVFWELRLNRPAERKRTAAKEDWPGAGQARPEVWSSAPVLCIQAAAIPGDITVFREEA